MTTLKQIFDSAIEFGKKLGVDPMYLLDLTANHGPLKEVEKHHWLHVVPPGGIMSTKDIYVASGLKYRPNSRKLSLWLNNNANAKAELVGESDGVNIYRKLGN